MKMWCCVLYDHNRAYMNDFFIAYWCAFRNKYVEWIHIWGKELYRKNYHHWYHQNGGILFSMFFLPLLTFFPPTFIRMLNSQVFSQKDENFFSLSAIFYHLYMKIERLQMYAYAICIVKYGMYEILIAQKIDSDCW
jgi:hypothetical protein